MNQVKTKQQEKDVQDYFAQVIDKQEERSRLLSKWSKVRQENSNYHMQKKGFQHLLKEIQETT